MLNEDKSEDGLADKERRDLQKELRGVKAELKRKEDALSDSKEEFESAIERYKEREKELKARLREAKEQAVAQRHTDVCLPLPTQPVHPQMEIDVDHSQHASSSTSKGSRPVVN